MLHILIEKRNITLNKCHLPKLLAKNQRFIEIEQREV